MMDEANIRPDVRIFNSLMSVCAKCAGRGMANVGDGEIILLEMQKRSLCEDQYTYNSMIDVCVRDIQLTRRLDMAYQIVMRMDENGVRKDEATSNLLLQCARSDWNVSEARSIFEKLGRSGRTSRSYTIFLSMAVTLPDALALLERARREGIQPNAHMYNAALDVCLQQGWEDGYLDLRAEMKAKAVWANAMTERMDKKAQTFFSPELRGQRVRTLNRKVDHA